MRGPANAPLAAGGGSAPVVLFSSADCWRGASVSFGNIAAGLSAGGLPVALVAQQPEVIEGFASAGHRVIAMGRGTGEGWRLRRQLQALNTRVLVVDRAHDLRVAARATLGLGVAVVSRYNEFRPTPPSDALIRLAYRSTVRELVFLSEDARVRVLRAAPFMRRPRPITISEGVDTTVFRPNPTAAAEFRASHGISAPFVLAVGALSPEKRYDFLLDALRCLGAEAPPLVICGEGPDETRLRARAADEGIAARFLGRVDPAVMVGAYNACAALIHAGQVETFGLAVLEAMACARPAVVVASGALPEVVGPDGECAVHVPAESVPAMAAAIRRMVSGGSDGTAMGRRGRDRAINRFSLESMQLDYRSVVLRCLGEDAPFAS